MLTITEHQQVKMFVLAAAHDMLLAPQDAVVLPALVSKACSLFYHKFMMSLWLCLL
jgi:hypothetical protein